MLRLGRQWVLKYIQIALGIFHVIVLSNYYMIVYMITHIFVRRTQTNTCINIESSNALFSIGSLSLGVSGRNGCGCSVTTNIYAVLFVRCRVCRKKCRSVSKLCVQYADHSGSIVPSSASTRVEETTNFKISKNT